jgi:hypothetical protein
MITSAVSPPPGASMVIPSIGFAVEAAVTVAPWPGVKVFAVELNPLKVELPRKVTDPAVQRTDNLVTF